MSTKKAPAKSSKAVKMPAPIAAKDKKDKVAPETKLKKKFTKVDKKDFTLFTPKEIKTAYAVVTACIYDAAVKHVNIPVPGGVMMYRYGLSRKTHKPVLRVKFKPSASVHKHLITAELATEALEKAKALLASLSNKRETSRIVSALKKLKALSTMIDNLTGSINIETEAEEPETTKTAAKKKVAPTTAASKKAKATAEKAKPAATSKKTAEKAEPEADEDLDNIDETIDDTDDTTEDDEDINFDDV